MTSTMPNITMETAWLIAAVGLGVLLLCLVLGVLLILRATRSRPTRHRDVADALRQEQAQEQQEREQAAAAKQAKKRAPVAPAVTAAPQSRPRRQRKGRAKGTESKPEPISLAPRRTSYVPPSTEGGER